MFSLIGKTALITGAASGIGAAMADVFARAGAVVYVADRDDAAGQRVCTAITSAGGQAAFVPLDVTREQDGRDAVTRVEREQGRLDILVNNAGIGHVGRIDQTEGADLDRLYAVNVRGVFNLSKACIGGMITRGSGVIVNTASVAGVLGVRDRLAYTVTKFAEVGLTKAMALDHATHGIRVNCLCPGRVETPFVSARLREYPDPEAAYREMSQTQPIGRMGRPEEIAAAALYLASDEAAFVTGTALMIDGGWTAGT